jgi:hypothetical protein
MIIPFDSVFTYHDNIYTCGVARFNHYLAQYLSVPLLRFLNGSNPGVRNPLVSLKISEISEVDTDVIASVLNEFSDYSLILHDYVPTSRLFQNSVKNARVVMGLNNEIVEGLRNIRGDVVSGHTVASYEPPSGFEAPHLVLLTFGMAHKIQSTQYGRIADLLRIDSRSFLLEISSALHEGTQFDDSFFEVGQQISTFFGGNVRFLGFLADSEVSRRVSRASALLAFFPHGARENNNSVVSAMHLSTPVITNLDDRSPSWLRHEETVFDINQLRQFPSDAELTRVGRAGQRAVSELTYANLLRQLGVSDFGIEK